MTNQEMTRRSVLKGGAALAGTLAMGSRAWGVPPIPEERPVLVVFWLNGGPAGLFNSADSFLAKGTFGVTTTNVRALENGLYVDAGSLGALPPAATAHMASINFRHGILRPHEKARAAVLETGPRSQLLRVAAVMPAVPDAAVRCAVVNRLGLPVGVDSTPPAEGGATLEPVVDFGEMSRRLGSERFAEVCEAYHASRVSGAIDDQHSTFAAVESLIHAGASVIFTQPAFTGRPDRQFDTHGDDAGVAARQVMAPITPSLAMFLDRVLALPGRNVVTLLAGEFSRTVPESDHEPGGTATVIGKHVKTGTAGPQAPDGSPPAGAPSPEGLWAYVSAALRLPSAPFGRNPSPELVA
jgi:hypothetical protein